MSATLNCCCGSLFISDGKMWHCPFSDDPRYHHDSPITDHRVGLTKPLDLDSLDLVDAIMHLVLTGPRKPGPAGLPGSRLRRQPWNQGKKRNGARIQAKRAPSRREASLAAEWSVFVQSRERGLRRFERKGF